MKRFLVLILIVVSTIFLVACSFGNDEPPIQDTPAHIVSEVRGIAPGSEVDKRYYAKDVREEFTFDQNGVLIRYLKVYTFKDSADKESALAYVIAAGFNARVVENELITDNSYYIGRALSECKVDDVKGWLDKENKKYTVK